MCCAEAQAELEAVQSLSREDKEGLRLRIAKTSTDLDDEFHTLLDWGLM